MSDNRKYYYLKLKENYFDVGNRNWVFSTDAKELIRVDSTAIVRHTKIKATANPFIDADYIRKRKFDKGMHRLTGKFKTIWKNQNGLCYHCGMPMDVTEEREIIYLTPKSKTDMLFWLLRTPTGSIFTITLSITLRLWTAAVNSGTFCCRGWPCSG